MDFKYNTIEEALDELRNGRIILVTDDPDRENEGDMMKCLRMRPETWARSSCPFSSFTRYMVAGSTLTTVPITSIESSFGIRYSLVKLRYNNSIDFDASVQDKSCALGLPPICGEFDVPRRPFYRRGTDTDPFEAELARAEGAD